MSVIEPRVNQILTVEKRDGRIEDFDVTKIRNAIRRAMIAQNPASPILTGRIDYLVERVMITLVDQHLYEPSVEEIQDAVENVFIREGETELYDTYHSYRIRRTKKRERNSEIFRIYKEITFSDAADSDVKRENANVNGDTPMGTMLKYGSEGAKQ